MPMFQRPRQTRAAMLVAAGLVAVAVAAGGLVVATPLLSGSRARAAHAGGSAGGSTSPDPAAAARVTASPGPGQPEASQQTPGPAVAAQSALGKTGSGANAAPVVVRAMTTAGTCGAPTVVGGAAAGDTPGAGVSAAPTGTPVGTATPTRASAGATWRDPMLAERVPVLMYHRIVPLAEAGDSLRSLVIPPELFDAQMTALQQAGWHAITLRQLALDLAAGRAEPPRTFVPTFDDGYRDGYSYAAPILARHGFVGTFFVITGRVGMPAYLTPADLCALTRAGDEVGNHTVHHVGLGAVSAQVAATEIEQAGRMILGWTGVAPITLAYPFGSFDATAVDLLAGDGYQLAATTVPGAFETFSNRLLIPRVRVGPSTDPLSLVRTLTLDSGL